MFVGQTQEPAPYSRTVRIGMITVVAQDEEEEDILMESNGEGDNGQYEYTEYMHADDDDDDGPPLSIPQPMRGTKVGKVNMTHPRAAPQYMGQKLGMQGIWLNGVVTEIRKTIWRYPAQRVN